MYISGADFFCAIPTPYFQHKFQFCLTLFKHFKKTSIFFQSKHDNKSFTLRPVIQPLKIH